MQDGRVVDGGNQSERKYQIKVLWDRHREILRLRLLGHFPKDIAVVLGITVPVVNYTINSALGRRHLALMRAARDVETIDVAKEIDKMVPKAIKILDGILDETNPEQASIMLRAKVATDVVERKLPKVSRVENLHAHFTADEINEIKDRARGMGSVAEPGYQDAEVVDGP